MRRKPLPNYLAGYPQTLTAQVSLLIEQGRLGELLQQKYPRGHEVRTDKALYEYLQALKNRYLRHAGTLAKVAFDSKLQVLRNALGTHTRIARVQGASLQSKREIRVASIFKEMPEEFLRMIAVHELAHVREPQHDKAFYQLCLHMEPNYHQVEFDLRAYLSYLDAGGPPLWPAGEKHAVAGAQSPTNALAALRREG